VAQWRIWRGEKKKSKNKKLLPPVKVIMCGDGPADRLASEIEIQTRLVLDLGFQIDKSMLVAA
jgi:hypothetical protein